MITYGEVASSKRSWPISYGSIEAIVCALDILLLITVSVATGAIYALLNEGSVDLARYVSTAILAGAVFVLLFRRRCLYDPSSLVNWSLQVRKIATLWMWTFLLLAGAAFALKIGKDFSRGAVLLFAVASPAALIIHHALWRSVIDAGLRKGRLRGRTSVLVCLHESVEGARIAQNHTRDLEFHGFRIDRSFQLRPGVPPQALI